LVRLDTRMLHAHGFVKSLESVAAIEETKQLQVEKGSWSTSSAPRFSMSIKTLQAAKKRTAVW
jgi:hypothetical protein